jgi:hypothetical protein
VATPTPTERISHKFLARTTIYRKPPYIFAMLVKMSQGIGKKKRKENNKDEEVHISSWRDRRRSASYYVVRLISVIGGRSQAGATHPPRTGM